MIVVFEGFGRDGSNPPVGINTDNVTSVIADSDGDVRLYFVGGDMNWVAVKGTFEEVISKLTVRSTWE